MSKATYDSTVPISGSNFSSSDVRNNFQSLSQGDSDPLRPRAQGTPDMTVAVGGALLESYYNRVYVGENPATFTAGNSPSVSAPTVNPRIDVLVASGTSALSLQWLIGAESGSPSTPTIPDEDLMPICSVYCKPTMDRILDYEDKDTDGTEGYIYRDLRPRIALPQSVGKKIIMDNYWGGRCYKKSTSEIYISPFSGVIPNAGETLLKAKRFTSVLTFGAANIDTGSMQTDVYYYIYLTADGTAAEPRIVFSTNDANPVGYVNYLKIGWFYNEANGSLNITHNFVGNIQSGNGNPNIVKAVGIDDVSTVEQTYVDMPNMLIYFVSNGRPIRIDFSAPFNGSTISGSNAHWFNIEIDGTNKIVMMDSTARAAYAFCVGFFYLEIGLAAGTHTIKIQWHTDTSGTLAQEGSTEGNRILTVEEK